MEETPKSSVFIGISRTNQPFWGVSPMTYGKPPILETYPFPTAWHRAIAAKSQRPLTRAVHGASVHRLSKTARKIMEYGKYVYHYINYIMEYHGYMV